MKKSRFDLLAERYETCGTASTEVFVVIPQSRLVLHMLLPIHETKYATRCLLVCLLISLIFGKLEDPIILSKRQSSLRSNQNLAP